MSVDTTAAQYDKRAEDWQLMRDVSAGERAVKDAGTTYLPVLGGQDDSREGRVRYKAYKDRAPFYNATARTIDGLSGMIFRKPPIVERPEGMESFEADVTLGGLPLHGFAELAVEEVLTVGRAGVLVDFPRVESTGITQAQAERMNLRPFLSMYRAEDILNWSVGQIGNRTVVDHVRLGEWADVDTGDEFEDAQVYQIRVLELIDAEAGGVVYQQRVFRQDDKKKWIEFDTIEPTMNGARLDFIPFVFLGPQDTRPDVDKPPLIDLAFTNISHYRTAADLEHGAHFTALPTPYVAGSFDPDKVPPEIGPEVQWMIKTDGGTVQVGMLEFTGTGLEALEKRMSRKEEQMAAQGARLISQQREGVETAETARIHQSGEVGVLASLAQAVGMGLTRAMEIARDWMTLSGDVGITLNRDFMPVPMDPQMLDVLLKAVQQGRMSQREFFEQLQRGEIVDETKSFEDHQSEVETDAPSELSQMRAGFGG